MGRPKRDRETPELDGLDEWHPPWELWTVATVALFLGAGFGWWLGVSQ